MDFGELKADTEFINCINNFDKSLDKINDDLDKALDPELYDKLSTEDKVKYDLYMAYCLNSLFWMYLRTKGGDPNKHGIKNELSRVREYMLRNKQVIERTTLRPKLDKDVAGRFVRGGLWDIKDKEKRKLPHSDVVDLENTALNKRQKTNAETD